MLSNHPTHRSPHGPATRRLSPPLAIVAATVLFGIAVASCAPAPIQVDSAALVRELDERAEDPGALLRDALALFDEAPLRLGWPASDAATIEAALDDPASDAFWHLRAMAWQPEVRTLRRDWRAARHAERAAGRPEPLRATGIVQDLEAPGDQSDLETTVDVLGLLGIGPRAAERTVAARSSAAALARLEAMVWRALFDVDRARVALASRRESEQRLAALLEEAQVGLRRAELLEERDRLPLGIIGRARSVIAQLERARLETQAETARALATLSRAAGLPPSAEALGPTIDLLDEVRANVGASVPSPPAREDLLARLPALRAARLDLALAEARLRAAIAEWWPSLRVGPRLRVRPDELLLGGIVSVDLPWPPSVDARVDVARELRDRAYESLGDQLLEAMAIAEARRVELLAALATEERIAEDIEAGSAEAWRSARARLAVGDTLDVAETWLDALELRMRGALAAIDARERALLAELSYREVIGAVPRLTRDAQDRAGETAAVTERRIAP